MFKGPTGIPILLAILTPLAVLTSPGCYKADVTVPSGPYYTSTPEPSAQVAPAAANDRAGLLRENQQLRQRIAWLDQDNIRLDAKIHSLQKDQAEIQSDINRAAAQRDRYRQAAGK